MMDEHFQKMDSVSNEGLPGTYEWFSDQIAGHHPSMVKNGKREIGLLKNPGSKEILKPKQDGTRGEKEVALYKLLSSSSPVDAATSPSLLTTSSDGLQNGARMEDVIRMKELTAKFHRMETMFVDGQDRQFMVLEDVTSDYTRPAMLDLKMGQVTYDPSASAAKIERETKKYPPQAAIGFRICGYRIHQSKEEVQMRDRSWGKSFDETNIQNGLAEYFSARADRKMVLREALDRLQRFKEFFESQESFKFFGSSLLFVYEAQEELPINLRIVMIDFSHVFESNGERDEGYLFGIKNLEKYINSLISET
ncbi:hypothetical protein B9Z55_024144 [Caenorhabditis nigoni]|uniref:Kinase n=2 Tax=Caenorhabditis nigoni TaxID=1611254 RepID=A0A2G5STA0_9PELO|nr:hypothetical protein B9Z55_024144 [Caenorhabditis nigoni]